MCGTNGLVLALLQRVLVVLLTAEIVIQLLLSQKLVPATVIPDYKETRVLIELGKRVLRALDVFQDVLIPGLDRDCACSRLGRQRNLLLDASVNQLLNQVHIRGQQISQVVVDVLDLDMTLLWLSHNIGCVYSLGCVIKISINCLEVGIILTQQRLGGALVQSTAGIA